jgi:hypothetical protein
MCNARAHEGKRVCLSVKHILKWGTVQGMKLNNSQVHSHFASCTRARVVNVQNLDWKDKQAPNWGPRIPLESLEA